MRVFEPLPVTRTSPDSRRRADVEARELRDAQAARVRELEERAVAQPAGVGPPWSTRRTAWSGESACGRSLGARGARTPAHGFAATLALRASQSKSPRQLDSTRASERGDWPLPCSVRLKRRMSCRTSSRGRAPRSARSSAPSRAYARRIARERRSCAQAAR
jgi:hypothetical protein